MRGRPSPKKPFSLVKICALRGHALEPWETVVLYFRMRGKRAECYWAQQMMWAERYADCPWDQRMSFLQTHSALGILGELPLKAHMLILEVVLAWKETVTGWRGALCCRLDFANMGRRAWGTWGKRLELLRAQNSSWGQGWGVEESALALGYAEIKRQVRSGVCEQTPATPDYGRTEDGNSQLVQVMGWSQDRPLASSCSSVIVIHCTAGRENEDSFPFEQY